MVNLRRIEKKLSEEGHPNIEVTKKNKTYYVLHILRNGNPVPLYTTENKKELEKYLETNYGHYHETDVELFGNKCIKCGKRVKVIPQQE